MAEDIALGIAEFLGGDGEELPAQPDSFPFFAFEVHLRARRRSRYEESTNELINEELGIAYPIIDGIPNMIPEAARTTRKRPPAEGSEQP